MKENSRRKFIKAVSIAGFLTPAKKELKKIYPFGVIIIILTCIGGENSEHGAKRFKKQVINYKPDVLFIDYALNDAGIGAAASRKAWEQMINAALKKNIKVNLLTATPDQRVDLSK